MANKRLWAPSVSTENRSRQNRLKIGEVKVRGEL